MHRPGVTLTVRLSESLLSVFTDTQTNAGRSLAETSQLRVEKGTTVRQVLATMGINSLLVPMASLDNRRVDMDCPLEADGTLTLYGPLAGG